MYFEPHHGKIFLYFYDCESAKLKNWSTQFLVVHREKHGFDNMRINEKNESKIKKEIFLELDTSEIQRVIIVFSFLCSRVNIRYQKVIRKCFFCYK